MSRDIIDYTIDKRIAQEMVKANAERERLHREKNPVRKGNLTASMLGKPTQWSVLKMCGLTAKEPDEYTLRKFARGYQVEEWIDPYLNSVDSQVEIKPYRGVTGICDYLVDTKDWATPVGVIPLEVKSTKNSQYSHIVNRISGGPKLGHCLQALLYALAIGTEYYALTYVAADDLRTRTFLRHIDDPFHYRDKYMYGKRVYYDQEIDLRKFLEDTITAVNYCKDKGVIPEFNQVLQEAWHINPDFCDYPAFMGLSPAEAEEKLKQEFPDAYKRLKEKSNARD